MAQWFSPNRPAFYGYPGSMPSIRIPNYHFGGREHYPDERQWFGPMEGMRERDPFMPNGHPRAWRRADRQTNQHYLVRPKDGKRNGYWGRLKDGLTGEGPDVFAVTSSDPRHWWDDVPDHARWSKWTGPLQDEEFWPKFFGMKPRANNGNMPWASQSKRYDPLTRKYTNHPGRYTDARYFRNAKIHDPPYRVKDRFGDIWGMR